MEYWKDRLGRGLMWLLAALAIVAFVEGIRGMGIATPDRIWVEAWRTFAYVTFAGLFALLALRPRNSPAIWELTFGHKLAVTLFGFWLGDSVPEVSVSGKVNLALSVMIAAAWVLCRGWMSWATWNATDPGLKK
jgi:hypothetical protein